MIKMYILSSIVILSTTVLYASGINTPTAPSSLPDVSYESSHSPSDGSYYIGDFKRLNGTIEKNCYAKILRSDDNSVISTGILCPQK